MRLTLRFSYFLLFCLILKSCDTVNQNDVKSKKLRVRVKRQDSGYVYNKPSISFDLPSIKSTQAPTVDRILTQQMYYAYPAPVGVNTINIGSTAGSPPIPSTTAPGSTSSYNYKSSTAGNVDYNYGSSGPTEISVNTATQASSTIQNSITSTQSAGNSNIAANSGYGYNTPFSTLSPSLQGSSGVSTNAPRYLPPIAASGAGTLETGGSVNIGDTQAAVETTGLNTASQSKGASAGVLSENYLPPLVTNTGSSSQTTSTQTNLGGSVSIPSTDYLPPKSSPSSTPQPFGPTGTSQTPASGYIPPSNTGFIIGNVPTPSSGYLPPRTS